MSELPSYYEGEQNVLGALLVNPCLFDQMGLTAHDFYHEQNRIVFNAIASLHLRRAEIDANTVADKLTDTQLTIIGGPAYLTQLLGYCPIPTIRAIKTADKLKEYTRRRELISKATEIARRALDLDTPLSR
jgi:replicative DNA helicase